MTITIYLPGDGTAVIRWPAGLMPDSETVKRVAEILNNAARDSKPPA